MAKTAKGAGSGAIGKVAIIYGEVKAISPDGTVRILGPNSLVFADDQIITGSDGSVSLILDGTPPIHLDLGRMSQLVLDEDVYGGAGTAADAAAEADKVQQALLAGDQPIEPEAPAAGGEANAGGGHPVVNYSLTGAEVTPDSGAETRGIGFGPLEVTEGDTVPIGGDDIGAVDDEGINECWIRGNLGGDESDHPTNDAFIVGKLSYNFGADGPHPTEPFAWSMTGLPEMGITSHGHTLLYEVVDGGTTLNAYYIIECGYPNGGDFKAAVSQEISFEPMEFRVDVFSLELTNIDTGAYTFTLFKPLDHPIAETEDDINYIFGYGLKDGDNSTGSGVLRMTVDDDTPVMGCRDENRTVDEDDINNCQSDGNYPNDGAWTDGSFTGNPWYGHDHGPANIWGSLMGVVAFGADGPADNPWTCGPDGFSFAEGEDALCSLYDQNLSSKGEMLSYKIECNTLIGYVGVDGEPSETDSIGDFRTQIPQDRVVFTLELDGNGFYKFSLYDQLDHENPCVDEVGDKMAVDGGDNGLDTIPIDFSGIIVATDFDGDPVTLAEGKFVINITDDEPKEAGCLPEIGIVEEEALPDGNQEIKDHIFDPWLFPIPDTAIAEGTLAWQVSVGADEPVTFSMSGVTCGLPQLTSNGEDISYDVIDNVLYAYVPCEKPEDNGDGAESLKTLEPSIPVEGRLIFTLELQENGDYKFTLIDQIDHDDCGEDSLCIDFSSMIVATDFDGDSITLNNDFYIKVIDDVPDVWVGGPDDVKEDGAPICGTWNASIGADQPGSVEVMVGSQSYALGAAIPVWVSGQNVGTLTVNGNGTWLFDPNTNLYNEYGKDFSFKIKATDADGDNESDCQTIEVKDGTKPSGASTISLGLDEEALDVAAATGTNPDSTAESITKTISFTAGSDDLTLFRFGSTSNLLEDTNGPGADDLYRVKNPAGTEIKGYFEGTSNLAITLTLTAPSSIPYGTSDTVTVTATLSDNLKHALANGEQTLNLGSVRVYAYDHDDDDDYTYGTVNLSVKDDVPTAVDDCITTKAGDATGKTYNLMLILDTSGSLSDSQLQQEVDAMKALLNKYEHIAEGGANGVGVQIVSFASGATLYSATPETIAAAIVHLDAIADAGSGGGTNYEDAIANATTGIAGWQMTAGHENLVYFVSDGEPNYGYDIHDEEGAWENALDNVGATAWAIGVGAGVGDADLQDVAYPDSNVVNVNDFDDLLNGLIGTVVTPTADGNVMTNDLPGADGAEVTAVSYIDANGKAATAIVDDDGVTIKTQLGELFIESDGDFSYKGNPLELLDDQVTVNPGNTVLGSGIGAGGMVKITVEGDSASLIINDGAFGVASNDGGDGGRFDEINYLGGGKSEAMIFELQDGKVAGSALVNITEFYNDETGVGNEVGSYELFLNGEKVQDATLFTATSKSGNLQLLIDGPECGFDEIRFMANEGTNASGGKDNSDYSINSVTFDLNQQDVFHYEITDGDGDKSCADLTININVDTLIDTPDET